MGAEQVVPIDWKRLDQPVRAPEDYRRSRQILLNSAHYNFAWAPAAAERIEQGWRELTGRQAHDVIRPACSASYALAVVLKTGIFDETIGCWQPMDQHTANWGSALLAVHRLTGEKRWLEVARAAGAALTQYQLDDGRTMTWICDRTFGNRAYYGAPFETYSFWSTGWAFAASFWAELAALEEK